MFKAWLIKTLFCGLPFQEYLKEGVCNLSIDEAVQVRF